jgi:hypothetical protein
MPVTARNMLEHKNCTRICIKLMRGGKGQGGEAKLAATVDKKPLHRTNGGRIAYDLIGLK